MVLSPTAKLIGPDAEPDATVVPFTLIVAVALVTVGVRVTDVVAFDTDAVYVVVPDAKMGVNVPVLMARLESGPFTVITTP